MLSLAIKARIPIVGIRTEDVMYLDDLFSNLLEPVSKPKKSTTPELLSEVVLQPGVYYLSETSSQAVKDLTSLHKKCQKAGATLILVNRDKGHPTIFEIGTVMPSKDHILKLLKEATGDTAKAEELLPCLGGCGLKATSTYLTLTMARDKSLTPEGVTKTRKQFFRGSKGLTQVDLAQSFYMPNDVLAAWAKAEKGFFLHSEDYRLRPRGILMDGIPGVGKTEGAKWLARQWGVPLFRLDIASTKDKYVGESQRYLELALANVIREAPCILLMDEVEKLLSSNNHDSSGTSSEMLSQLLWFLAEHREKVLTVMTTNDKTKIPPELIREGRIDEKLVVQGLDAEEVKVFAVHLLETFKVDLDASTEESFLDSVADTVFGMVPPDTERVAHSMVRKMVIAKMKNLFTPQQLKGA